MVPNSYTRVSEYNPHKTFYKFTPEYSFVINCKLFCNASYAQHVKNHDDLTLIPKYYTYRENFYFNRTRSYIKNTA